MFQLQVKLKEALLVEKLKKYEVPKLQGPMPKPDELSGEERFYMKKMAQKRSNYVPVGRRGVFGGVTLNMHLLWKKHETVKVVCKPCKPGQIHEYARDIARLSGGVPIQIIGDDTIIFYRGKDYVQPEVVSPIDTLSKKKALEKSKYEQSLETVRRFIAISEKELELYYRHVALYGDPNSRNSDLVYDDKRKNPCHVRTETSYSRKEECADLTNDDISTDILDTELDSEDDAVTDLEIDSDNEFTEPETESEGEGLSDSELGEDNRGKWSSMKLKEDEETCCGSGGGIAAEEEEYTAPAAAVAWLERESSRVGRGGCRGVVAVAVGGGGGNGEGVEESSRRRSAEEESPAGLDGGG